MHPLGAEVISADGQMDRRAEAVVALRNLANAPKKCNTFVETTVYECLSRYYLDCRCWIL
jgi:hypothetical protein